MVIRRAGLDKGFANPAAKLYRPIISLRRGEDNTTHSGGRRHSLDDVVDSASEPRRGHTGLDTILANRDLRRSGYQSPDVVGEDFLPVPCRG